jgi:hypothetical protein
MYRLAKKYWFNDFGAYRNVAHDAKAKASELKSRLDGGVAPKHSVARAKAVLK